MATQGLVSVTSNGEVLMKVVAGSDGMNANWFSTRLKSAWPLSIDQVYSLALDSVFGHKEDLVVITADDIRYCGDGDISPRYRDTYDDPRFNPRWIEGLSEYTIVLVV